MQVSGEEYGTQNTGDLPFTPPGPHLTPISGTLVIRCSVEHKTDAEFAFLGAFRA